MSKTNYPPRRLARQSGFTFIEVMVVMAIVGIITAIAVPSYGQYLLRTARADAQASMLQVNQYMERYYAANNAYDQQLDGTAFALPGAYATVPANSNKPRYQITIQALTPTSYTIQAAPQNASATDKCGVLTLTSTGARGAAGIPGPAGVTECWR